MNDASMPAPVFDRTTQDVGNIVEFGHVNIRVPDQRLATLFYITGLGLTRDPYLVVGVENMWVNVGTCQFHLPTGTPQVLNGVTGVVVADIPALVRRLKQIRPQMKGTAFAFEEGDGFVDATCPWGNRIRCHAPHPRFGRITVGIPYVEIDAPTGTAERIARFYREILAAPAHVDTNPDQKAVRIAIGRGESMIFRETERTPPAYDGHHVQIALADFSGPHAKLKARGLITEESNDSQYRFTDIVDLDTGEVLVKIEHEVRSMRHPMYARVLVNRNPVVTNNHYATGHEAAAWTMSPDS
jgi:catechol 2,3-dioxygenase-like lactoylglutathione lyase family enzyme